MYISATPEGKHHGVPLRSAPFAGLANQGATCYLNSLLQSLYMTPEFRSLVYKWTYVPGQMEEREERLLFLFSVKAARAADMALSCSLLFMTSAT